MVAPDYPLLTPRLALRPLTPADTDAVHAYQSREDVCRYVPYSPRSREEVAARLADPDKNRSTLSAEGQALVLGVELHGTGALVGDVMLFWRSAEHRGGELGYQLHPDHHGNGYAVEACGPLLALAFDGLGLHRVVARVDARNEPSARVLRRLGFRQEAVLVENEWFKGGWSSEIDFALLDREWRALAR